ncbi:MAG: LacI family DNA-binding transcriptional regulator [Planctomycetes bacterium]|nr:LacI family DNA-binding transcriptional regulator [Planctomycetota bacterium]
MPEPNRPRTPMDNGNPLHSPGTDEPINQKDIARLLGLSTATVSRSLRNDESIRATTRARVFQAAQELGYRIPEARRGAVRTRRIKTLQLLVGSATGLGPAGDEIIAGISEAASAHDAHLSVYVTPPKSGGSLEGEFEPPAMRAGMIDGAILLHSFAPQVVAGLATRLPVVSMVHRFDQLPIDCIDTDERAGVVMLYDMLRRAGHMRIGFVKMGGTKSWERARLAGFRESCFLADVPLAETPILNVGRDLSAIPEVVVQLREHLRNGVTAWICACDPVAYHLNGSLRREGVTIGADVVIAGFDGLAPPPGEVQIPTVRVPYRDLGTAAVRRLSRRIESPTSRIRDILLRNDLVPGYLAGQDAAAESVAAAVPQIRNQLPQSARRS